MNSDFIQIQRLSLTRSLGAISDGAVPHVYRHPHDEFVCAFQLSPIGELFAILLWIDNRYHHS